MKAQVGKYYYAPHRSIWGVWQWNWVSESGGASGTFIKDFISKEDARAFVCWGKPSKKLN